jgi:hypothetical protein
LFILLIIPFTFLCSNPQVHYSEIKRNDFIGDWVSYPYRGESWFFSDSTVYHAYWYLDSTGVYTSWEFDDEKIYLYNQNNMYEMKYYFIDKANINLKYWHDWNTFWITFIKRDMERVL